MALFPVKRFLGDDEEEEADVGHGEGSDGRARLILQRLNEGAAAGGGGVDGHHPATEPRTPKAPGPSSRGAQPRPKRKRKGRHGDDAPEAVAVAETTVAMAATKPVAVAAAATKPVAVAKTAVAVAKKATKPVAVATKPVAVAKKAAAGSTFTVLADVGKKTAKAKVERVLPDWLARPRVVSRSIRHRSVPTSDLPWLHPRLYSKMAANGIHSLFPVQVQVIPAVLEGAAAGGFILGRGGQRPSDICVSAPTGSGKTLAFVIPIVQLLMDRAVCQIRALVVLPTKELAQQVWREFRAYADSEGLRVVLACGAQRFGEEQQSLVETTPEGLVVSRADVVVATAGRLVDHLARTPGVSLAHLRFLVVDEADRMMDSLSQDWLSQVTRAATGAAPPSMLCAGRHLGSPLSPGGEGGEGGRVAGVSPSWPPRAPLQKLLLSATLTHSPESLQTLGLFRPLLFSASGGGEGEGGEGEGGAGPHQTPRGGGGGGGGAGEEYYVPVSLKLKPLAVLHFALHLRFRKILCFTNTRQAAHRLYHLVRLYGGVEVAEFSSMMSPAMRRKTLKRFQGGDLQLLVSSDAAARGIDVRSVTCVLSYDCPDFIHNYVHRVGRTARAGAVGLAYTLVTSSQVPGFVKMRVGAGRSSLHCHTLGASRLQQLVPRLRTALTELKQLLKKYELPKQHKQDQKLVNAAAVWFI
ncbi:unnamed protein product [Lampetra fluviatilis]